MRVALWGALVALTLAVVAAGLLRSDVRSATAESTSMAPALTPGDRLLYWVGQDVRRGDLVLDRLTPAGQRSLLSVGRIIGLPGDTVGCCTAAGLVTVNGRALHESYVFPGDVPSETRFTVKLRPGQVWLMGDDRSIARDSRLRGPVPLTAIAGRVTIIDRNGRGTAVRTPATFVATWLAPPDHRPLLPYGWLAAVLGAGLALIAELVIGVVLLVRARRRNAAPPGVSLAGLPAGYR